MRLPRMCNRSLMCAVALVGLVLGGVSLYHHIYYLDLITARDTLGKVNGITDVQVFGFDDMTYEVTLASFALKGRPDAVIETRGLGEPGHVILKRLGPLEFHECIYGFHNQFDTKTGEPVQGLGFGDQIDVGPAGQYAGMLPVKIRDLNDVVSHYDELVRFFSTSPGWKTWRELERWQGKRTAYRVRPIGSGSYTPPSIFPTDGSQEPDPGERP